MRMTLGFVADVASPAVSSVPALTPPTLTQLFIDCHASLIFSSGSSVVSLNVSLTALIRTCVLVPSKVFDASYMFTFILVESSSDRMILGRTYGSMVPGGDVDKVNAQDVCEKKRVLAASAITRILN